MSRWWEGTGLSEPREQKSKGSEAWDLVGMRQGWAAGMWEPWHAAESGVHALDRLLLRSFSAEKSK